MQSGRRQPSLALQAAPLLLQYPETPIVCSGYGERSKRQQIGHRRIISTRLRALLTTWQTYTVTFQPAGRRGSVPGEHTLLDAARVLGVELESVCGGKGTCGKCRVHVEPGQQDRLSAPTEAELRLLGSRAIEAGARLACQCQVRGDVQVFVPEESRRLEQVVRKEAGKRSVLLDPIVRAYPVVLTPPTLADLEDDADRLLEVLRSEHRLEELSLDFEALKPLPRVLREAEWKVTAVVWNDKSVIAIRPQPGSAPVLGLAVDIGTTTLAAYLVNLSNGDVLATEASMNPQVAFGDDVISRMQYAKHNPDGAQRLQEAVVKEIGQLAAKAVKRTGASLDDIFDVVIAGNTVMHHLFLGIDTSGLGSAPFVPAIQGPVDVKARALNLGFHPGCRLHVLPVEAGFVGADNVAALIAERPYDQDEVLLIIDIGTNGELVLGNRERLLSTSCATGPALEGAHLEFGMRAAPGAIERVRIEPDTLDVRFKVIGLDRWQIEYPPSEVRARGICGSGIIEAVSEMLRAGIIQPDGSFTPGLTHKRLILDRERAEDKGVGSAESQLERPNKFIIALPEETALGRAITISQEDIRAVQLAKGALRAGAEILLRTYGITQPDRIILAGAFGTYIDIDHAFNIGMFPECDLAKVVSVGNAAGDGARFALLNRLRRTEAAEVARRVEYIELATRKDFLAEFVKAIRFPEGQMRPAASLQERP